MTQASRKPKPKHAPPAPPGVAGNAANERSDDVVLVHGATEDGGYRVLRKRGEQLLLGEMRAVEEGKPLTPGGEVVALRPREGSPLFDAETLFRVPGGAPGKETTQTRQALPRGEGADVPTTVGGGPAQVSTPAYREGWGAIFGGRSRRGGPHTLN
ncbi:MAG: hypothetical protein R3B40_30395 [Polyangiales bacterium]